MPGIVDLLRLFKLTALRANGSGVAGATVRILDSSSNDVTAAFFGTGTPITPVTDSQGLLTKLFVVDLQSLPAGQPYTIQVIAAGFELWTYTTANTFIGAADLTANLVRPAVLDGYTIEQLPTVPLSSMAPIVTTVTSPNSFDWEYIRCRIEQPDGKETFLEAPVDKVTSEAVIDFRSRVKLGIRPLLVADGQLTRDDTDFSTWVGVSFASLSPEGETQLESDFSDEFSPIDFSQANFTQAVAATEPPEGDTDLAAYVSLDNQKWIVPPGPVVVFRGFYRDVSIWLPVPSLPGYTLHRDYLYGDGESAGSVVDALTESPYVQRIKVDANPAAGIVKCILTIYSGEVLVTEPLTLLYRD